MIAITIITMIMAAAEVMTAMAMMGRAAGRECILHRRYLIIRRVCRS